MKIFVNRVPVFGPWGGGAKWVNAFYKHMTDNGHSLIMADSIKLVPEVAVIAGLGAEGDCPSADQLIMYKMMQQTCGNDLKLLLRVNENDARKGTSNVDDFVKKVAEHVDHIVFVSEWLRDYYVDKGLNAQNSSVIVNGVDTTTFAPISEHEERKKIKIVAHHWSDNHMKGADVYEKLDEFVGQHESEFEFTYIGRHRCNFKHTNVIKPLHGKKLGEELTNHDVYVSASRFDPGPNHITEALACGLPTYVHHQGGGCVEFAGDDHVYDSWDSLRAILLSKKFEPNKNAVKIRQWSACIAEYNDVLELLCKKETHQ